MKKLGKTNLLAAIFGFLVLATSSAYASGTEGVSKCQVIYGGGQVCEEITKFTIDKEVQTTTKGGQYVDNLSINDEKFAPGTEVVFRITVTNTGENTIESLDVADILPSELEFVAGPGNYNEDTRTLSYRIDTLDAGETHENTFTARTAAADSLPNDQGIVCTINTARAVDTHGSRAEDTSEVCIQKVTTGGKGGPEVFETQPVKEIPETGVGLLSLIALIPGGLLGMHLRKLAK